MRKEIDRDYLLREYIDKERSIYDISKECNTYPNAILRALRKHHIPVRDKSAAQSAAIRSGRHKHPTRGKKRTEDVRIKISQGVAKAWESIPDTEREYRINQGKRQWEAMDDYDKDRLRTLAAEAVRMAATKGSKLEQYLLVELKRRGYQAVFHKANLVSDESLQVDIFVPELRTAIEVDGPAHFFPIWGEENLSKHLSSDHTKTGLLLAEGYVLIRIKNLVKNVSKFQYRNLLTNLLDKLQYIKQQFPPENARLIEIELV
jgi:very-short-patch-repair endonuclease